MQTLARPVQELEELNPDTFKSVDTSPTLPTITDIPKNSIAVDDIQAIRHKIFDNVLKTLSSAPAHTYGNYVLKLENLKYADPDKFSIQDERDAIIKGNSLTRRLVGDYVLIDAKTGKEIARRKQLVARVPYLTSHGSFIFNGNAYSIANQLRLKPGVFIRLRGDGNADTFVNTVKGLTHHYTLDPEKGIFYMSFGNVNIPLFTVLKALNVPDEKILSAWGQKLYASNAAAGAKANIAKLFKNRLSPEQINQALPKLLESMKLDPTATQLTIGIPATHVTPDVMLEATKKMLKVWKGEAEADERDALHFQKIAGVEHLIPEYVFRAHQGLRKFIPRAVRKNFDLSVIPSNYYWTGISDLLLGSGLAEILEEINPTETLDRLYRVTKLGAGGIEQVEAVPEEARSVHQTHMGFIDPAVTGKLKRVGVDLRLAFLTRRDENGKLYTVFKDVKSGKFVWRSPEDLINAVVVYPGEMDNKDNYVLGSKNGRIRYFNKEEVDYELPYGEQYFNTITNFLPAQGTTFPQRIMMGQQMHLQALPLINAEEPLVQGKLPNQDNSFQRAAYKYYGVVKSDVDGIVESVSPNRIVVRDKRSNKKTVYELYNNFPFNRKTFIHNTPVVKTGDEVYKNQLLATSNFSDKNGNPAFGLNAYIAFLPYRGYNYEDAYVVSESFAKRLNSEHMYQETLDVAPNIITGKDAYKAAFPGKYSEEFYNNYDENGFLKPGRKAIKGQPLILAVKSADPGRIGAKKKVLSDASIIWDHENPGVVIDTHKGRDNLYINIKSNSLAIEGDKLTGRFGDKGVIARIIPDSEMPRDSLGRAFDLLVNPLGLATRGNMGQIYEAVLGKIAAKNKKPVFVPAFMSDYYVFADNMLKANRVSPTDTVYDPKFGTYIPNVLTGYKYVMKLHHMAESKLQERETAEYTAEDMPARGGKTGAKYIGFLELMGILGHNAFNVIRDAKFVRGQRNDRFWLDFMRGATPTVNTSTLVYDKFVNLLKAAGINIESNNDTLNLFALTNSDIANLTADRVIRNSNTVKVLRDDVKPITGGLFDPTITGGLDGRHWSYFELSEPFPNPVMEDVIRTLLDLTEKDYIDILIGKKTLEGSNKLGPEALKEVLSEFNVDKELDTAIRNYRVAPASKKSALIKKIRYLRAIKQTNQKPEEWFWTRMPIIPPIFRPVSLTNKVITVADVNALYQDLYEANEILNSQKKFMENPSEARLAVYNGMKAVAGIGDPIQVKHKQQGLRGLLQQIVGTRSKTSYVMRKLIGITTDLVGRAVIIPNPALDIDHVGIPIEMAWTLFRPVIIRNLTKRGLSLVDAIKAYNDKSKYAVDALLEEINNRVVIVNRAPVLHRYGVMAFKPVLTKNKVVEFNPQITSAFGADFDGDAVQVHLPILDEAQKEAKMKMLPSKNLFSSANFGLLYPPIREYALGLWLATAYEDKTKKPVRFKSIGDLLKAYNKGEITINTPVEIG